MNRYTTGRKAYTHKRGSRTRMTNNMKGIAALMQFVYITFVLFGVIMMMPTVINAAHALIGN